MYLCHYNYNLRSTKAATRGVLKLRVLKDFANFIGKHLCWSLFLIKLQARRPKTPIQMFSCEICEILRNTYFEEHLRTTTSKVVT